MQHPTRSVYNNEPAPETMLVLTGPPAAGKTTIQNLLEDFDVPVVETSDIVRTHAETQDDLDPENGDDLWAAAEQLREEFGPEAPTKLSLKAIENAIHESPEIVCIGGVREDAEVEWIDDVFDCRLLVVRIDAPSGDRSKRYVERHLSSPRSSVSSSEIRQIRDQLYERESREMPYPDHHVTIENTNGTSMRDLSARLAGLLTAFAGIEATPARAERAA